MGKLVNGKWKYVQEWLVFKHAFTLVLLSNSNIMNIMADYFTLTPTSQSLLFIFWLSSFKSLVQTLNPMTLVDGLGNG